MMQSLQHILIIRGGAIGDFILTLPVLAALRAQYPAVRIEVLGNPSIASLARKFGLADNVRDLGSQAFAPLFSRDGVCSPDIAEWLSHFDLIVSYVYDPDRTFETSVRRCSSGQFITGPHRPNENVDLHASEQLVVPLRKLGLLFDVQSSIASWTFRFDVQRSFSKNTTIAVHPGSGSTQKNWPEEKWRSLFDHLVSTTDDHILLIGGEAERDRLPKLAERIPPHRREIALERPLAELADSLRECRVFVGHDSGITHLAAVLGLDCIVLWGPSNERVWRPLGDRVQVLRHPESLRDLPVGAVTEALNSLLTTS